MDAAILAAGLGTRLRPLTHTVPKALVPVLNRPLLGVVLAQLKAADAVRVAVNTHHLAEQVQAFLAGRPDDGLEIIIRHEPAILGTGGGLRSLGEALGDGPFLAMNVDILTDLDLAWVYRQHQDDALATLVLHDFPPFNKVWLDATGWVRGIGSEPPRGAAARPLAYTGVQVVSPRLLAWIPGPGPADLVAAWRRALAAGERVQGLVVSGCFWQDLGTPAAYLAVHQRLGAGEAPALARFFPEMTDPLVASGAVVDERAVLGPGVCLGAGVRVEAGAYLENTVVWAKARIGPGVKLSRCIVGQGARVTVSAREAVLI